MSALVFDVFYIAAIVGCIVLPLVTLDWLFDLACRLIPSVRCWADRFFDSLPQWDD